VLIFENAHLDCPHPSSGKRSESGESCHPRINYSLGIPVVSVDSPRGDSLHQ
jgi:hypothetical protein